MELDSKMSPQKNSSKKRNKIEEFINDETLLKVGSEYIWLWVGSNRASK
jgi:putative transposase